jgi:F-type H+-transporting ATPase subunit alpha
VQNGHYDTINVDQVVKATTSLREFFETRGSATMDKIRTGKQLTEEIEAELSGLLKEWQTVFSA